MTVKHLMITIMLGCVGFASAETPEGWIDDYEVALKRAAEEKKNILVNFTGSDWCGWCKELDKAVFATEVFRKEAPGKYVLLYVDTPSKPSMLSEKARKQNPTLVEKYGVEGFPTILILDATGRKLAEFGYQEGGPEAFLKLVDETVRDAPDIEKYIKPIVDILNALDIEMKKEMEALQNAYLSNLTNHVEDLSAAEQRKLGKAMQEVLFGTLLPKYIPLYDKAIADAYAISVPSHMEAKKKELIDRQESNYKMMKKAFETYQKKKAEPDAEGDGGEGEAADEKDVLRSPAFVPPMPKDARTEIEFFEQIALPFYTKHIVETYDAASETNAEIRTRILRVRESLARHLAYLDVELYPEPDRANDAQWLWSRGCRDAAVALYLYDSGSVDDKFWKWKERLADIAAKHDVTKEPILGMILRRRCYHRAEEHYKRWPRYRSDAVVKSAYADFASAFNSCTGILSAADCRIAEWMDIDEPLPVGSGAKLGNRYLDLCQRAAACKHAAFAARGEGWAKDVSEEGWKGWQANNRTAESNLLEAVSLRPERARPAMMLADLYGRSCGSGDPMKWFNWGVSNSLDEAALTVAGSLHFMTSRWGGSTDLLLSVATNTAANVCTSSRFAYITAALAIGKVLEYDYEGMTREAIYRKVLTPEVTEPLFRMFDAYIAANNKETALRPDFFRTTALTLALEARDWNRARAYYDGITKGIDYRKPLKWVWLGTASVEKIPMYNLMMTLGRRRCGRELIDAEQALSEGRFADAYAYYGKMCERRDLSENERWLAGGKAFTARKKMQEKEGGWVNLMPNRCGGDTWDLWNDLALGDDGRARVKRGDKVHALSLVSIPGPGTEVEATVHFEKGGKNQKDWNIGWGWVRPFRCSQSGWAFPYIGFSRDERGDRFEIDAWTEGNSGLTDNDSEKWRGNDPMRSVCTGKLAASDSHTFRAVFGKVDFVVEIDGKQVYTRSMKDLLSVAQQHNRMQWPSGDVMPTWKVYQGCAFSDYRYRIINDDAGIK